MKVNLPFVPGEENYLALMGKLPTCCYLRRHLHVVSGEDKYFVIIWENSYLLTFGKTSYLSILGNTTHMLLVKTTNLS